MSGPGLDLHAYVTLLDVMLWWAGTSCLTCALKGCCFHTNSMPLCDYRSICRFGGYCKPCTHSRIFAGGTMLPACLPEQLGGQGL